MKSNITIASNIYNRVHDDPRRDPNFALKIVGRPALQKIKNYYSGSMGVQLSQLQERMHREDKGCSLAKSGEMTHGVVRKNTILDWEGRCEYAECPTFSTCKAAVIYERAVSIQIELDDRDFQPLTYEWLGNIVDIFHEPEEELLPEDEEHVEDEAPAEVLIEDVRTFASGDEYVQIDNPKRIIESAIESKILVNAAPGSGKTYTVIRRLEHIIRNHLVNDFSSILVLVYTNAAKNEILNRIEEGISNNSLPYTARNVDICTFDSLATSYLITIEAQYSHLDYNGRIALFNEKFKREDFSNFEYVIVDELQDLVNARARMVLLILGALQNGYLLVGDKCQAIYDYDCHDNDSINSVEFYKRLNTLLPPDIEKYELTGNQRQTQDLAVISDNMRCALLGFEPSEANDFIMDEISNIQSFGKVERFNFLNISERTAILCRNNGEAEYISHLLHKDKVSHTLLRSVTQATTLQRFIADCLWDYHSDKMMSQEVFIKRYLARVSNDKNVAYEVFDALSEVVYENVREAVDVELLAHKLCDASTKIPAILLNEQESLLTVSTIHKAKGREFDTVFLLDSGYRTNVENTEEARVWYVGCTRAKKALYRLSKNYTYLKRSSENKTRWTQRGKHRGKWGQPMLPHCCGLVLGLPLDFSEAGFVMGDFLQAIMIQQYIANNVSIGDCVEIILDGRRYQAKHNGNIIGYMSGGMVNQLWAIARESNRVSNAPPYLSPVYVANIVSITPYRFPEETPAYFRQSKFWLGVELTGFPQISWRMTGGVSGE
jgi:hypothetical protein